MDEAGLETVLKIAASEAACRQAAKCPPVAQIDEGVPVWEVVAWVGGALVVGAAAGFVVDRVVK